MTNDKNAVLFCLAGKNYFNGTIEINKALDNHVNYQGALDEIETIGIVHIKIEGNREVYFLNQFAKEGIQNQPPEYCQDPYGYLQTTRLGKTTHYSSA